MTSLAVVIHMLRAGRICGKHLSGLKKLIELRKHLGLNEIHLLGQSWGGMQTLEYICNYQPEGIKSIILSSTLPASWMWAKEAKRMIEQLPEDMQAAIRYATETGDYSRPEYQKAEDMYMEFHCGWCITRGCTTMPDTSEEKRQRSLYHSRRTQTNLHRLAH